MDEEKIPLVCYTFRDLMTMMIARVQVVANAIKQDQVECFLKAILDSKRIFVVGAGRSGFVAKAFAMRLMHLGFEPYVVGETVTPAMNPGDILIAISGSGKTKSVLEACEAAKTIGGSLCLITGTQASLMAVIADCMVYLESDIESHHTGPDEFELRQLRGEHRSTSYPSTPLGTVFETSAMIFLDTMISALIEVKHCNLDEIIDRYANMQ